MSQPDKFLQAEVRFICEQDGAIEQEFKRRLTEIFKDRKTVTSAYLAAVDYGTPATFTAALCLRTFAKPDPPLVQCIGVVFGSIFSSTEHLDILFLDDEQEMSLKRVCPPFYEMSSGGALTGTKVD